MNRKKRKKNSRQRKNAPLTSIPYVFVEVVPTKHSIDKYKQREQNYRISDKEASKEIQEQVKFSKLLKYDSEGSEHRVCKGRIFICKRETIKGMEKLIVITIKLSSIAVKNKYSKSFTYDDIDFSRLGYNRPFAS